MPPRHHAAGLVIASNRAPVELRTDPDGNLVRRRGGGGLIAVLGPAAAAADGVWVASAMTEEDATAARHAAATGGLEHVDVTGGQVRVRLLDHEPATYRDYYGTIATELLWFTHHHLFGLALEPVFDARLHEAWTSYRAVNDSFAAACSQHTAPGGTVLLQDYHLSLAPRRLRELRPDVGSAHFTMTPWADPGHFDVLPRAHAAELVDGILGADMAAFLVRRWARAFLACCERLGRTVDHERRAVRSADGRWVAVRCFPVGVDADELRERCAAPDVAEHRRRLAAIAGQARLITRVDRMEPAKNVLRGVAAYAELLTRWPRWRGRVVHFVHAYSSRDDLPAYRDYAERVTAAVAEVNRAYGTATWQPVVLETANDFGLGLAAMSLADVVVTNPLRDGMNLVAKEAAVVSERDLALVLSAHAGAADDLGDGCALVDPVDVSALAEEMHAALELPGAERTARLARLRKGATALPPRDWLAAVTAELDVVTSP